MILIRCACCACCAGTGLIPPSKVSLQTWSFLLTAGAVGNTLVTIAVSIVAVSNAEDHAKTALVVKGATNNTMLPWWSPWVGFGSQRSVLSNNAM